MDSMYIKTILQKDEIVSRQLKGVFAANERGSHWCVFYFDTHTSEFLDSMGQSPEFYHTYFRDYLTAQDRPYKYICEQLQSPHSNV